MSEISSKRGRSFLFVVAVVLAAANFALGQRPISPYEARNHVGEFSKVCGQVASALALPSGVAGYPLFSILTVHIRIKSSRPRFGWKTVQNSDPQKSVTQVKRFG